MKVNILIAIINILFQFTLILSSNLRYSSGLLGDFNFGKFVDSIDSNGK